MLNINLTESEFVAYMDFRGSIKNYKNTWVMILSIVRESSSDRRYEGDFKDIQFQDLSRS